jgi:tetratricopeptide (TPR) repeat protein
MIERKIFPKASSWLLTLVIPALALTACSSQQGTALDSDVKQQKAAETLWEQDTRAAFTACQSKDYKSAKELFRKASRDAQQLGQDHPAVAASLSNMADFYYAQGDGQQADALYRRALKLKEKNLGTEHVELSTDLIGLGSVAFFQKKYADALPYFERALKIRLKALGPNDPRVAEAYACVGQCDLNMDKNAEAVDQYKNALTILDKLNHPVPPSMLNDYAKALRKDNNATEAAKIEARAKSLASKTTSSPAAKPQ